MKNNTSIETTLEHSRPTLSEAERASVWSSVAAALPTARPVVSPYQFSWLPVKQLAPVALVLIVVLGVGSAGTYAAAQSAKPGDFLFPIERALEDLRLTLATEAEGEVLRAEFARERLLEIQALIDAELARLDSGSSAPTTTNASTTESQPKVIVSGAARTNIDTGINELLLLLGGLRGDEDRTLIFTELRGTVDGITIRNDDTDEYRLRLLEDGTRIEIRGDVDDRRIEVKDEDQEVRIREKDGELRIDVKDEDEDEDEDDEDEDDDDREDSRDERDRDDSTEDSGTTERIVDEAEANVFTDGANVKVELRRGSDLSFTTTAITRVAIVSEIARRTGATTSEVEAVLDLKTEDRSLRDGEEDETQNDNDEEADNQSRDDDEEDRDDTDDRASTDIRRIDVEVKRTVGEVELEYVDGEKNRFLVTYTTRALLVSDLALRLNLTITEVESLLRLEIDND